MSFSTRIGRRLKLQDLHVLIAVVQAGSMGKAARQLNTSQPNVSKSIADLERALGVSLLDRHHEGVEPTEYGRALLDGGVAVFDELRQTVKKIEFLADPAAGEVRIGSITPLAASFVSAVVDRLSRRYPRITFDLITGHTGALHRELEARNVDLLVVRKFGLPTDQKRDFEFIFDDSFVVVAGMQNPWARKRSVRLTELVNEPWVMLPSETAAGSVAREVFRISKLNLPRATVVTGSSEVRFSLLATGRFMTILSDSALKFPDRRRELKILPITLPAPSIPNGIVTLKGRTLSPAAQLFIEYAREVAKSLAKHPR